MHIRITARAALPGGGMANPGTVLDLPEAEAAPLLEAGMAEPLVAPEAAPEAEPLVAPEAAPEAEAAPEPAKARKG